MKTAIRTVFWTLTLWVISSNVKATSVLSKEQAKDFCQINVVYNDRVCPLQTYALDFTKKLYGKRSYNGYSAEQVLTGFLFWYDEWKNEPVITIKDGVVCERLNLPKHCSVGQLISSEAGGYILGPYLNEYYRGMTDKFHEGINKIDEKLGLIMELHRHIPLKVFPFTSSGVTAWYSPSGPFPDDMEEARKQYMQNIFNILGDEAKHGKTDEMDEAIHKIRKYQVTFGGASIPSSTKQKAELFYNAIPFATILFMFNLAMGIFGMIFLIYGIFRKDTVLKRQPTSLIKFLVLGYAGLMILSMVSLTICLVLRWIVRGTVPMSNGYETMLVMAWMIMAVSLLLCKRFKILLVFGFLLSGFFLLVSHISQMDPQITHLMPVLSSPLLTIHVSIIMMAYALLALTFICGLTALLASIIHRGKRENGDTLKSLRQLSQIFLYPSLTCLGFGIFIGAIWANISWGTYWSWDPKETWALITLMVYAVAVHDGSIKWMRNPLNYHIYITLAFLALLMTYFGVNYFLGGMHSYA